MMVLEEVASRLTPEQLKALRRKMLELRAKYAQFDKRPMDAQGGFVHLNALNIDKHGNIEIEARWGISNDWEDWEEINIDYISKDDLGE